MDLHHLKIASWLVLAPWAVACGGIVVVDPLNEGAGGSGGSPGTATTTTTTTTATTTATTGAGGAPPVGSALVRMANLAIGGVPFDFCLSGDGGSTWIGPVMGTGLHGGPPDPGGLAFHEVSAYIPIPAGPLNAAYLAPGSADCSAQLNNTPHGVTEPGKYYTITILHFDGGGSVGLHHYEDNHEVAPGTANLGAGHEASSVGSAVDIGPLEGGMFTPVITDLQYRDHQSVVTSPLGDVTLAVRRTGTADKVLNVALPGLPEGSATSLYLLGFEPQDLELFACLDNQPPVEGLSQCFTLPEVP